jgi:hypothetical protein
LSVLRSCAAQSGCPGNRGPNGMKISHRNPS